MSDMWDDLEMDWGFFMAEYDVDDEEDVDDILERWLNGEDVSDYEDDGAQAQTKEEKHGRLG